jgi:hypothetical protein
MKRAAGRGRASTDTLLISLHSESQHPPPVLTSADRPPHVTAGMTASAGTPVFERSRPPDGDMARRNNQSSSEARQFCHTLHGDLTSQGFGHDIP